MVLDNLPSDIEERDIYGICEEFAEVEVHIDRASGSTTATVHVLTAEDQEVLLEVLNKSRVRNHPLRAFPSEVYDIGKFPSFLKVLPFIEILFKVSRWNLLHQPTKLRSALWRSSLLRSWMYSPEDKGLLLF